MKTYARYGIFSITLILLIYTGYFLYSHKAAETISQTSTLHGVNPEGHFLLPGTNWAWSYTMLPGDRKSFAPQGEKFILSFEKEVVTSTTDCNSLTGKYIVNGEVLSFSPFSATKMFCGGSLEGDYTRQLSLVSSFVVKGNELHLILIKDAGEMIFTAKAK